MFETRYHHIDGKRWKNLVWEDDTWYANPELRPALLEFFQGAADNQAQGWQDTRREILDFFTDRLRRRRIKKGGRTEYFNDDDRVDPETGKFLKPGQIDTVVVHHTASKPLSRDTYNALGMLRLYVPVYTGKAFQIDGQLQPISSGHFMRRHWFSLEPEEVFWGYHFMVNPRGKVRRTLKDGYTGFHASVYDRNCTSIGVAIEGDHSDREPSDAIIDGIVQVVRRYPGVSVIGHREVIKADGTRVQTVCPGNTFEGSTGWKTRIERRLAENR